MTKNLKYAIRYVQNKSSNFIFEKDCPMESKYNAKGHDITNRGRKVNSVIVNRPDIVEAALAQLNKEQKQELVLRNIRPKDRTTENGLKSDSFVRFNLSEKEMENYPDHSMNELYIVKRVLYAFETSNSKEQVIIHNMQNEAMGYVDADCLNLSEELELLSEKSKPTKKSRKK